MPSLYENIRQRREELGLSQWELAQRMGYTSRSSISKIESGENDIPQSKIKAFATALETTPSALMGWEVDSAAPAQGEGEIGFDDFTYALHNEAETLTEEQKEALLGMARFFNQQLKDEGK